MGRIPLSRLAVGSCPEGSGGRLSPSVRASGCSVFTEPTKWRRRGLERWNYVTTLLSLPQNQAGTGPRDDPPRTATREGLCIRKPVPPGPLEQSWLTPGRQATTIASQETLAPWTRPSRRMLLGPRFAAPPIDPSSARGSSGITFSFAMFAVSDDDVQVRTGPAHHFHPM